MYNQDYLRDIFAVCKSWKGNNYIISNIKNNLLYLAKFGICIISPTFGARPSINISLPLGDAV